MLLLDIKGRFRGTQSVTQERPLHFTPPQKKSPPDLTNPTPAINNSGIVLRGSIYQLRVRIPAALMKHIGCREIRMSLRTSSPREAMRRGTPLLDMLSTLFGDIRRQVVTNEVISQICDKFLHSLNNQVSTAENAKNLSTIPEANIDAAGRIYRNLINIDKDALKYGRYSHIEETLLRFADSNSIGIDIDRNSHNYHLLLQQALLTRIEAFKVKMRYTRGEYEQISPSRIMNQSLPDNQPSASVQTEPEQETTIKELCDKFIEDRHETEGAWDENSTLPEVKRVLKTFREIMGGDDMPVSLLNRSKLLEYKRKRSSMPIQQKQYANLSIAEKLNLNVPEDERISKATFNHELIWVSAMISWAHTNEHIPTNCAQKLSFSRRIQDKNRKEECQPYTKDEIRDIFEKITFNPNRPERFWCTVIAAYTGMRLNEVAQLLVSDVCRIGGVLCFKVALDINEATGKKLKTQQSKRNIPVHKDIIALGFEEYLQNSPKAKGTRLFPKLPKSKRGYGVELGKWYGREISDVLFPNSCRQKVFNSFRHSVEDQYKNLPDLRDSMQLYLTGHATGKEDFDRYGSDPMAIVLKDVVDRIDYGDMIDILKQKIKNPVTASRRGRKPASEHPEAKLKPAHKPSKRARSIRRRKSTDTAHTDKSQGGEAMAA